VNLTLEALGWNASLEKSFNELRAGRWEPGRVAVEDKHFFTVFTADGELLCQVSGKLFHESASPSGLPKVGDWVALAPVPGERKAVIHRVLSRRTKLSRKVAGRETEEQILAANLDMVFMVQGLDRTVNPALLQRHLAMVLSGGAKPAVVLNKADLCDDVDGAIEAVRKLIADAPVMAASARTGQGVKALAGLIGPGVTVGFIGPSGAGKSSLINRIYGEEVQATTEVRERDAKGRHTTTWRELIVLPNGGLVIDTPGMREFQMWKAGEGARDAFPEIEALAAQCHFRECSHTAEKRCAVRDAVSRGELSAARLDDYFKLKLEFGRIEKKVRDRHSGAGSFRRD
jgi:ribosome biogenesis GTPase